MNKWPVLNDVLIIGAGSGWQNEFMVIANIECRIQKISGV